MFQRRRYWWFRIALLLLVYTGCRISEVVGSPARADGQKAFPGIRGIDFRARRRIRIHGKNTRGPSFRVEEQPFSGPHDLWLELCWLADHVGPGKLVPYDKRAWQHCVDYLRPHLRPELAAYFRAHQLRHSYVVRVYRGSGKDLVTAQRAARHSKPETTLRYLRHARELVSDEEIEQAFHDG